MPVFNNILAGAAGQTGGDAAVAGPIKSVRFNSGDSAYLNRTPSSAGSNTTWTFSTWVKKTGNDNHIFGAGAGNTPGRFGFGFNGSDKIFAFVIASGSTVFSITTDAVFRDPAGWYHIVLIADTTNGTQADRFKIYVNGVLQSVSGTLMPSSQNTYVNTTAAHAIGRRSYTAADYFNGYLASTILIDGTAKDVTDFGAFDDNGVWQAAAYSGTFGTNGFHLFDFANESGIGNDSSGLDNDFTVNNIADSAISYGTTTNSSQTNANTYIVSDTRWSFDTSYPGEQAFDGSTSTVGSFGQVYFYAENGYSKPTVTSSSGGVEVMASGNGITAAINEGTQVACANGSFTKISGTFDGTLNSINVYNNTTGASYFSAVKVNGVHIAVRLRTESPEGLDVLRDVPTNGTQSDTGAGGEVSGNYATWNPLTLRTYNSSTASLSNGNLNFDISTTGYASVVSTVATGTSGKYYCEISFSGSRPTSVNIDYIGVVPVSSYNTFDSSSNESDLMRALNALSITASTTKVQQCKGTGSNNPNTDWVNSAGIDADDVVGIGIDCDTNTLTFYKNGTSLGTYPHSLESGTSYLVFITDWGNTGTQASSFILNAGQRPFAHPVSGYKSLCTTNLPTSTIADGSDYFDTLTWTGDGTGSRSFTGLSFQPDFTWVKIRSLAYTHTLFDSVRGSGSGKELQSDSTNAEGGASTDVSGYLSSFNSDGFSSTAGSSDNDYFNKTGNTYVAWNWDAGSSTVSNTDGSITSSVRANQTAGFSIVGYTGTGSNATVGHGLNAQPQFVIIKNRDTTDAWYCQHVGTVLGTGRLRLNTTDSNNTNYAASYWNSTAPTSSVVSLGSSEFVNGSGEDLIMYCFAPVAGYSAFGSYEGNGSADGPFVALSFAPRWVMVKGTGSSTGWRIWDSEREPDNVKNKSLHANDSQTETYYGADDVDFLSNGFKLRATGSYQNTSGATYIYAAFAENPFQANGGLAR